MNLWNNYNWPPPATSSGDSIPTLTRHRWRIEHNSSVKLDDSSRGSHKCHNSLKSRIHLANGADGKDPEESMLLLH